MPEAEEYESGYEVEKSQGPALVASGDCECESELHKCAVDGRAVR